MSGKGYSPIPAPIPDHIWHKHDTMEILRRRPRDAADLLRLAAKYAGSQERVAARINDITQQPMSQARINRIINRKQQPNEIEVFERIADGLDMPDHARVEWGLAPQHWPPAGQLTTPGKPLPAVDTPDRRLASLQVSRDLLALATPEGNHMDRQAFLRQLAALGLSPLVGSALATIESSNTPIPLNHDVVDGYERTAAAHRQSYWSIPAPRLFASVAEHARAGVSLLGQATDDGLRRRLASSVGEIAMLSARLAFFDLQRPNLARLHYSTAFEAAKQANDPALGGAVLAHLSFVAGYAREADTARDLTRAAQAHGTRHANPILQSWLHAVTAEIEATLGDPDACRDNLDAAYDALTTTGDAPEPIWLDFYDASRLDGFNGHCLLVAGRTDEARASLEASLRDLAPTATKQRTVLLADIAATHAKADDYDECCRQLTTALDVLDTAWYATGFQRIQAVRRRIPARVGARRLTGIDQRLYTWQSSAQLV
jgi:tetratricopeptide (TPR) repeat protein